MAILTSTELVQLQRIASTARLSSYSRHLGTSNAAEAYGAYMWSIAISTAFSPLVQAIEISLRNSMHDAISSVRGQDWFSVWATMYANGIRIKNPSRAGDTKGEKQIKDAIKKIRGLENDERARKGLGSLPTNHPPNWQRVLAELSFGFWIFFLNRWYWDVKKSTKLWPNHISDVFPGAPRNMHSVGALHNRFENVLLLRNRMHHHEPIWKFQNTNSIDDSILGLRLTLQSCLENLSYISPEQASALEKYGVVSHIEELCTKDAFFRFIGRSNGASMKLVKAKRNIRLLQKNLEDNQSIWLLSDCEKPKLVLRNATRKFF